MLVSGQFVAYLSQVGRIFKLLLYNISGSHGSR
jgi:hypothetical protein